MEKIKAAILLAQFILVILQIIHMKLYFLTNSNVHYSIVHIIPILEILLTGIFFTM